jgi:DNA-binding LacI/PurR family transcriptional regulator
VVTGVRTRAPELSFSCVDHFYLALSAFERVLALGYRKPALVLDDVIDRLVDGRFSAGILAGQKTLPPDRRVPAFTTSGQSRTAPAGFKRWLDTHKPDVVFILYNAVFDWLAESGRHVPRDVGVVQLEWRSSTPEIAGMNQHNDVVGEAAVDLLVGQIYRQEVGAAPFPRATMIGATWMDGSSVMQKKSHDPGKDRARGSSRKELLGSESVQ